MLEEQKAIVKELEKHRLEYEEEENKMLEKKRRSIRELERM